MNEKLLKIEKRIKKRIIVDMMNGVSWRRELKIKDHKLGDGLLSRLCDLMHKGNIFRELIATWIILQYGNDYLINLYNSYLDNIVIYS